MVPGMLAAMCAVQLELERESREAVVKEKSLVERALAAEQQLVDAVKKEAAATDEALQV